MSYLDAIDCLERVQSHLLALGGIEDVFAYPYCTDIVDSRKFSLTRGYMSDSIIYEAGQIKKALAILEAEHKKKPLNKSAAQ